MSASIGHPVQRPQGNDGTVDQPVSSPGFRDLYPSLCEFLATPRTSGQKSTTGTLTLFLEDGCFKLCLNDRPRSRSTFVSGQSLRLALQAADAGLASNRLNWRTRGYKKAPDRQKMLNQC